MSKKRYTYRDGGARGGVSATVAARELERIRKERGSLRPDHIVAEATAADNPLHPIFLWDDAAAGHQHRLAQARTLVRAVVVTEDDQPSRSFYVHVAQPGDRSGGEYDRMDVVVSQPDRFVLALAGLQRHLTSAREAIEELRQLAAGTGDSDRSARLAIAVQAFTVAQEAVRALH